MRACFALLATITGCIDSAFESTHQVVTSADEYIVVLDGPPHGRSADRADVDALIDRLIADHSAQLHHRYAFALRGFSARMTQAAAEALVHHPAVVSVEPNVAIRATTIQANATWGLDRIDQRDLPLDTRYNYAADGTGVTVFVIDSGINTSHVEFAGRINHDLAAYAIEDGYYYEDCHGHGTHVAGTIAGTILGVAKRATIVPIRIFDCAGDGVSGGSVAALDYVGQNKTAKSVVNMSLGGPASTAVDTAVQNLVAANVTIVVAAGNENQDACNVSPAREPTAITVAASTKTDARASFSNYGSCVDLFAPGLDITSAWINSSTTINTISGTSMASPHVAGVAALYLAQNPGSTPAQVAAGITQSATSNKLGGVAGSPNRLVYTTFSPPSTSQVRITAPADGAQVASSFAVTVDATNARSVSLAIDGMMLGSDTTAPYAFDVPNAAAGVHTIEATATDAAGATESARIMVTVAANDDIGLGGGMGFPPAPIPDNDGCAASHGASPLLALFLLLLRRRRGQRAHA